MAELERGGDHSARIASLAALEASITHDVDAGLAELGTLDDPIRLRTAMQLLIQSGKYQDAADLARNRPVHCKWIDLAIYANAAARNISHARDLIKASEESCEAKWVRDRCRIAVGEAVFGEVFKEAAQFGVTPGIVLTDADRELLRFTLEALGPIVGQVRLSGRVDSAIHRSSVEFATVAHGMLGQLPQIADLIKPLNSCQPVPLLLAQLTLRRICNPPDGLSGRLRTEHPSSFSAKFLAALVDREIYDRNNGALKSLIELEKQAQDEGNGATEQLSQAIFETASAIDEAAIEEARGAIERLLGKANRFVLFLDAISLLRQDKPETALTLLDSEAREDDAVWWQVRAKAHELLQQFEKASESWNRACELMPHPDMLNHFAGLSIQQRRFDDAIRALQKAAEQSPDDSRILERLAYSYTQMRRFPDASTIFERLTQLQPTVTLFRVNLALCRLRSGELDTALTAIDSAIDSSNPDLQLVGVRTEILKGLGRAPEAFSDLEELRETFWENDRFLVLYMDTAYRAGNDSAGESAFQKLMELQHSGRLPEPIFHPVTLEDIKRMGAEHLQQRDSFFRDIVMGKLPWLMAESALGAVAIQAWHRRTQQLKWLSDDRPSHGEWIVYATNGFSTQRETNGTVTVARIGYPRTGEPVVVDMSALITLHRLGRLAQAASFFGKLVVPASYGPLHLEDAKRITPHQSSRLEELKALRKLLGLRLISILEDDESTSLPYVDEYDEGVEENHFGLADLGRLLRSTERLTSEELSELTARCHRKPREERELPRDSRIVFAASTLRSLIRHNWLNRVLATVNWCVRRRDFEHEVGELREYDFQREIYDSHENLWREINLLRDTQKIEFRDSASCHRGEQDQPDAPPFLDSVLLAHDLKLRLLADDRVCQAAVLNDRPSISDASFGTDLFLNSLETSGVLTSTEVSLDLLRLCRWRYRFLLFEPGQLKAIAIRSRDNLPGPELREIAAYLQESMRDPGLFSGPEKADLPVPVAFRFFMAWQKICVEFLGLFWEDRNYTTEQLGTITRWTIESLLPAVPRGMLYSPIGTRMGSLTPRTVMLTAMIRFATVQPLERANDALRMMAQHLGMTDDEFFEAAAQAADGSHQ